VTYCKRPLHHLLFSRRRGLSGSVKLFKLLISGLLWFARREKNRLFCGTVEVKKNNEVQLHFKNQTKIISR